MRTCACAPPWPTPWSAGSRAKPLSPGHHQRPDRLGRLTARRHCDIVIAVKTISVSVAKEDYEAFRRSARRGKRPIAQLIREAMALYRQERLDERSRLLDLPVLVGHRPVSGVPARAELYEDIFGEENAAQ